MSKTTNETEFPAKDFKKLPDNWAESANSMKEDELKKVIVECEGNIYTIDQAKVEDHKLQGAKELSKELAAPYRDASSGQKAKIKYVLWLLSGRGVDLDHTDAAD